MRVETICKHRGSDSLSGNAGYSELGEAIAMYTTAIKPLSFEEFLAWDDGSGRDFELVDGIPLPLSEPNANHEDLIERLCTYLKAHCQTQSLPYVARQSKQIRLKTEPGEKEKSRKADIVVFDREEWQRMKGNSSSAAAYVLPPGVIGSRQQQLER